MANAVLVFTIRGAKPIGKEKGGMPGIRLNDQLRPGDVLRQRE
jgi:hypothetical protein